MLDFKPKVSIEEAALHMYEILEQGKYVDFHNPIYYNIQWLELLVDIENRLKTMGGLF